MLFRSESGQLSLAFISSADYSVLPHSLREFRATYPSVHIELQEATTDVQINLLSENKLDLGILIPPLPDKLKTELRYQPIFSETLMLAITEGSPLSHYKGKIPLKACADQPLIIFPRRIAPAFHDVILGCFRDAGLTPHIGQEAIQMQTIVGLVSAGMGIALVPQSVSNLKRPGVEYRSFKEASPRIEIGLAWRRDNDSPVLTAFINLMRKTHG